MLLPAEFAIRVPCVVKNIPINRDGSFLPPLNLLLSYKKKDSVKTESFL